MCMPMPSGSCWSFPFTSSSRKKALLLSRAISSCFPPAGQMRPRKVLADAGVDIRQASFWQGGFDVVDGLVRQLEKIVLIFLEAIRIQT